MSINPNDVVIRTNNLSRREPCRLCGEEHKPSVPFAAGLDTNVTGDLEFICDRCLESHFDMKGLARAVEVLNGLALLLMRGRDIQSIMHHVDCLMFGREIDGAIRQANDQAVATDLPF